MQLEWSIPLAALAALLWLVWMARRIPRRGLLSAPPADALAAYLTGEARAAAQGHGTLRARMRRRLPDDLQRALAELNARRNEELLPAARWLADNARFLQEEAVLSREGVKRLPPLPRAAVRLPRVCALARALCAHQNACVNAENLREALDAWQTALPLTVRELDALAPALRLSLLETLDGLARSCVQSQRAQRAARRAHALEQKNKRLRSERLCRRWRSNASFLWQLCSLNAENEWLRASMNEQKLTVETLEAQEQRRQSELCLWVGNAVTSLRTLSHFSWEHIVEANSPIHALLSADPVYERMDQESRAYYRVRLSEAARRTGLPERTVASGLLALCQSAPQGTLEAHTGYYLFDEGEEALYRHLQAFTPRIRLRLWRARHALGLFRAGTWLTFAALLAAAVWLGLSLWFCLPFACVALYALQQLWLRRMRRKTPPRLTPRMQLERLTEETRTLVVCPTLLTSAQHALAMVKHLSILHEANPEKHLHFLLLGDFQDSLSGTLATDGEIMQTASAAIGALCEDTGHPFFYLQRERVFSPGEQTYHSRERKRGGLETVLRLLEGRAPRDHFAAATVDPAALRGQYRYVITLDSDTLLPPGSALRMVGAMLHPLAVRQKHRHRMRGLCVLQPRMETAAHTVTSRFGAWLGGNGGTDAYNQLAADTDQDLFRRGTFMGKGILDATAFLAETEPFVPDGLVLSHDLLEGELSGCAYASDIVLYDGQPQTLRGLLLRLHRWTRGDWQLLPYVLPVFPAHRAPRNALDGAGRFKVWRNLLRSLIAPMRVALMLYGAACSKAWLWALALMLPELAWLGRPASRCLTGLACRLAILPCEAAIQLDAVARTLWRLAFSHRGLLSWTTAAQLSQGPSQPPTLFVGLELGSAAVFALLGLLPASSMACCAVTAIGWAVFALALPWLEAARSQTPQPDEAMRDALMKLAERTFAFFETAITDTDHALPPDNVQIDPNRGVAHRTSPTNIGLYLCSLFAVERLGLLSADALFTRLEETVSTLEKLPKWHALPYNWYDTQTLSPLAPAFVSSVDCGNLAACLLTCAQGVRELIAHGTQERFDLSRRMDELAQSMPLELLYDPDADLFRIGLEPDTGRPTAAHYDLLASEARLLSFVAIMLQRVPVKHWFRLGRPRALPDALLSYSGTMFEYLMPHLFVPLVDGTLLSATCHAVLRLQRRHRLGGAFGVSESGYYAFDPDLNYQYRAFGLPRLALDAGASASVLAPYASMLALALQPGSAVRNLQRMRQLGLEGPLGLFEAADFHPARAGGQSMRIVRSHMAHHQGMILCAVCNALCGNHIARLFSQLPRAQAYRLLWEERAERARVAVRHPFKRVKPGAAQEEMHMRRDAKPLVFPVDAHLLSGGGTSVLIDAQGGGFFSHNGMMLTRFEERCSRRSGACLYLRDSQSGAYWQPIDPTLTENVRFETSQAVFSHTRYDVHTELRIWVNPLDGSVIQLLTLENRMPIERLMEAASYLEPSLLPPREDTAHPAFHNLFVQTRRLGRQGVAARRRPRDDRQCARELWHVLISDADSVMLRIQTDRAAFLGRGQTVYAPRAMTFPISAVADSLGDVVDPCLSLRGQFRLGAQGKLTLAFVTHPAREDENEQAFLERYATLAQALRTYDSALTRGVVSARFWQVSPKEQETISRLTGALAYTGQPTRAGIVAMLPREALWRLGVSGDVPLLLLECESALDRAVLRLLLKAHTWHRQNGLVFDLALTLGSAALRRQAEEEIGAGREGVFLTDSQDAEACAALRAHARLTLRSDEAVEAQLDALSLSVRARPVYLCAPSSQWKPALPPAAPLALFNGYGGFTPEGDYQLTLAPGVQPPAPWCHPLCSETFGTLAGESGLLFSYAHNSQSGRLTCWPNDTVSPRGDETFFLRDADNGLLWSLTRQPLGQAMPVRVTYGMGEAAYEGNLYGISTRLTCFSSMQADAGLRTVQVRNDTRQERSLTLYHVCAFLPDVRLSDEPGLAWGACANPCGALGVCAVDAPAPAVSVMSEGLFQGLWQNAPFALSCPEPLPSEPGNTAVLAFPLHLLPGESLTLSTAVCFAKDEQAFMNIVLLLRRDGAKAQLHATRERWSQLLGGLQADLPDPALTLMLNRWLPYQVRAARLWMRAGFYQAGGAYGFRDQLQDMIALLPTHPEEVRRHLLLCARRQFPEGDVLHWWHVPAYGVRTRISDDRLFLPYVTALYVEASGDTSVLAESIPYLRGEALGADEADRLFAAEESDLCEPLRQHCLRAIDSVRFGARGLPLMGGGDWNDGMNRVGGENGESVWLGMFLCEVLRRFAPLCAGDVQERLKARRIELLRALDRSAWDGAWYLRGWYHDGQKLGGSDSAECRIDLLPQAWGVICGVSRDRCAIAMENAWRLLYEPDIAVMKLFTPPFDGREEPGYIRGYLPGVRENGGQYTHAACWAVSALHQLGQDDRAWELALSLLPTSHAATRQLAARYRVEPYAMAADVYANPQQRGRGGWTWYTGSAGWYLRIVLHDLLGFRKQGDQLRFLPVCPQSWDALTLTYRFGSATYHLHASRDCLQAEADGAPLPNGVLTLRDDGRIHEAFFPLR